MTDLANCRAYLISQGQSVPAPNAHDDHQAHVEAYTAALIEWREAREPAVRDVYLDHVREHIRLWTLDPVRR